MDARLRITPILLGILLGVSQAAHGGGIFRIPDIGKIVRQGNPIERATTNAVLDAAKGLQAAKALSNAQAIDEAKRKLDEAQRARDKLDAEIQEQTEQKVVAGIRTALPKRRDILAPADSSTLSKVRSALGAANLDANIEATNKYVFVHVDPTQFRKLSEYTWAVVQVELFWKRDGTEIEVHYLFNQKRLRSKHLGPVDSDIAMQLGKEVIDPIASALSTKL